MFFYYHVTLLSNFAKAYDKYARAYDKSAIPESSYPGTTFVLRHHELGIGTAKAERLLEKLNIPGDEIIIMQGDLKGYDVRTNDVTGTGLGRYIEGNRFPVETIYMNGETYNVETIYAMSMAIQGGFKPYESLEPRSISWLPVGQACQAKCKFCFSEASVSVEQDSKAMFSSSIAHKMNVAYHRGATRFVITGGGEPTLASHPEICKALVVGRSMFKTVLITNGVILAKRPDMVIDYAANGLNVLAISRHHYEPAVNQFIMGLDTKTEEVIEQVNKTKITSRLICVLQKSGINSAAEVEKYLEWAAELGVQEVCFKELYVSTTFESVYAGNEENLYSEANQVSLSVVLEAMENIAFEEKGQLPWGAPFFEGEIKGKKMRVAAYTEPSMFWERKNGIARSWNIMQDGTVLASLEDPKSEITIK